MSKRIFAEDCACKMQAMCKTFFKRRSDQYRNCSAGRKIYVKTGNSAIMKCSLEYNAIDTMLSLLAHNRHFIAKKGRLMLHWTARIAVLTHSMKRMYVYPMHGMFAYIIGIYTNKRWNPPTLITTNQFRTFPYVICCGMTKKRPSIDVSRSLNWYYMLTLFLLRKNIMKMYPIITEIWAKIQRWRSIENITRCGWLKLHCGSNLK